jgi:hypothetical protein
LLGETITINDISFTVVGRVKPIGHGNNDYDNQKVYIPLTTMQELFAMKGENIARDALSYVEYQPATKGDATAALIAVHRIIGERHGFDPGLKDAFNEWDSIKEEKMVGAIFSAMDVFLGGVGIVTLGLGAVGIVNIMLVSNPRDWPFEGPGGYQTQHPGAVLLGGPAAYRHQRLDWHFRVGGIHGPAATGADRQDAGLGPAQARSLVSGLGNGLTGDQRRGGGSVSGQQSRCSGPN